MKPAGVWGRLVWFAQVKYTIGGLSFSTLDMEHGVLRGNAPSPAAIPVLLGQAQLAKPYFSQDDPRIKLVRRRPMQDTSSRLYCKPIAHACCWILPLISINHALVITARIWTMLQCICHDSSPMISKPSRIPDARSGSAWTASHSRPAVPHQ